MVNNLQIFGLGKLLTDILFFYFMFSLLFEVFIVILVLVIESIKNIFLIKFNNLHIGIEVALWVKSTKDDKFLFENATAMECSSQKSIAAPDVHSVPH